MANQSGLSAQYVNIGFVGAPLPLGMIDLGCPGKVGAEFGAHFSRILRTKEA